MRPNDVYPARVQLTLTTGERKELFSDKMKGSPNDPISKDDLLTKFRSCLASSLAATTAMANMLAQQIFTLDSSADTARALVSVFPSRKRG